MRPLPEYQARTATVLIDTGLTYGAGVIITRDRVLTVKHGMVVDEVKVVFYDRKSSVGSVIWRSDDFDLALLSIDSVDVVPVILVCDIPKLGSHIFTIGHSGSPVFWTVRYGRISTLERDPDGSLILNMLVSSGDSGGGVFDQYGRLVGMIHGLRISSRFGHTGLSYMIPSPKICTELAGKL